MRPGAAAIARWRAKPIDFVREVLRVEPDEWQADVLRDLEDLDVVAALRIAMVASKGPGKSTVLAWVIWWFLCTRTHPKVVVTSITEDNLSDGLWAELSKWQKQSPFLLATFTWAQTSITYNDSPETWFCSARTWPKGGSSSQQADTLAGVHADHVLFVIDEGGGVPSAVAAAADAGLANATPGTGRTALFLVAGNPTHLEGPLYEAATTDAERWRVHHVNGDPDNSKRSPRVDIGWARALIAKHGRNHPIVLVNVLGQFPPSQSNKLLGPADIDTAVRRFIREEHLRTFAKVLGVDVARFGDDSSVAMLRQGPACFRPREWLNLDTQQLAGQVMLIITKHDPDATFIDSSGVGAGVYDRLMALGAPNVFAVDFGSAATESERYQNKRVEMWWNMAEWVREQGVLPNDARLRRDLTAPTYHFTKDNRIGLEAKEDMKKRGLPSPDFGDALALTHAAVVFPRRGGGPRVATEWDPFSTTENHHVHGPTSTQ